MVGSSRERMVIRAKGAVLPLWTSSTPLEMPSCCMMALSTAVQSECATDVDASSAETREARMEARILGGLVWLKTG